MTGKEAIKELEILKEDYWEDDGYGHETKQYDNTMLALDMAIKALEQEPRKGHWKLVQRGKFIDVCCSNCEAVRIKEYAYNYTIDELNKEDINECFGSAEMRFCPNCGADMRGRGMTRERIEDMREVVLPFVKKRLLETNYEGLGKSDAEEFTRDFNEILDLAIKALEQEPILDKIRAEIDKAWCIKPKNRYEEGLKDQALKDMQIIDRYKVESEE